MGERTVVYSKSSRAESKTAFAVAKRALRASASSAEIALFFNSKSVRPASLLAWSYSAWRWSKIAWFQRGSITNSTSPFFTSWPD